MKMTDPKSDNLSALLDMAAAQQPVPPDDLMARVLADAQALQPAPVAVAPSVPARRGWESFVEMIGGWPGIGGLATAGVAGLWIGFAPPVSLETLAAEILGTTEVINLLGTSFDLQEAFDG